MLFYEQKTFNSFQKIIKTSEKAVKKDKDLINKKEKNRNNDQHQKKTNSNTN